MVQPLYLLLTWTYCNKSMAAIVKHRNEVEARQLITFTYSSADVSQPHTAVKDVTTGSE